MTERERLLHIYLRDHRAAGSAGLALARRCRRSNRGTDFSAEISRLAIDIEQDLSTLDEVFDVFDLTRDRIKHALAQAGIRVAGLKLNGRLVGYSPLSRLDEIEGLLAGVESKEALWLTLGNIASHYPGLEKFDFEELRGRAVDQQERLWKLHRAAAVTAFTPERRVGA